MIILIKVELVVPAGVEPASDISEHVPVLHNLAKECDSVVELGVRTGVSTRAFLCLDNIKVRSYDLYKDEYVDNLFEKAKSLGRNVEYIAGNSLTIEIEPTDMMFVDTDHTYLQVTKELELHANKVKKYIAFHDTDSYASEVLAAVVNFMMKNREWQFHYFTKRNNGLTVIKRIS
jgi:phospholipid N-methyltransferase